MNKRYSGAWAIVVALECVLSCTARMDNAGERVAEDCVTVQDMLQQCAERENAADVSAADSLSGDTPVEVLPGERVAEDCAMVQDMPPQYAMREDATDVSTADSHSGDTPMEVLPEAQAIAIARYAASKVVRIPDNTPTRIVFEDGKYIVTFICELPPRTLGPDFHAQVTLDALDGKVLRILGGS